MHNIRKKDNYLALIVLCAIYTTTVVAASHSRPVEGDDGGFLEDWSQPGSPSNYDKQRTFVEISRAESPVPTSSTGFAVVDVDIQKMIDLTNRLREKIRTKRGLTAADIQELEENGFTREENTYQKYCEYKQKEDKPKSISQGLLLEFTLLPDSETSLTQQEPPISSPEIVIPNPPVNSAQPGVTELQSGTQSVLPGTNSAPNITQTVAAACAKISELSGESASSARIGTPFPTQSESSTETAGSKQRRGGFFGFDSADMLRSEHFLCNNDIDEGDQSLLGSQQISQSQSLDHLNNKDDQQTLETRGAFGLLAAAAGSLVGTGATGLTEKQIRGLIADEFNERVNSPTFLNIIIQTAFTQTDEQEKKQEEQVNKLQELSTSFTAQLQQTTSALRALQQEVSALQLTQQPAQARGSNLNSRQDELLSAAPPAANVAALLDHPGPEVGQPETATPPNLFFKRTKNSWWRFGCLQRRGSANGLAWDDTGTGGPAQKVVKS